MKSNKSKAIGIFLLITIVVISWGLIDYLPVIGDPNSAPNTHVSNIYIEEGPSKTNSPNLVTGVLADYRGFDTLLETTVMFLAGITVAMVLSNRLKRKWDNTIFKVNLADVGVDLRVSAAVISPLILVYAIYVLVHGEVSLGGGFQAGTLFAVVFILCVYLAQINFGGIKIKTTQHFFMIVGSVGVLIYAFTGILPMVMGGKFLQYDKLPFKTSHVAELHSTGILLIEIGVTVCVMATIITILEAVLERNSLNDGN